MKMKLSKLDYYNLCIKGRKALALLGAPIIAFSETITNVAFDNIFDSGGWSQALTKLVNLYTQKLFLPIFIVTALMALIVKSKDHKIAWGSACLGSFIGYIVCKQATAGGLVIGTADEVSGWFGGGSGGDSGAE